MPSVTTQRPTRDQIVLGLWSLILTVVVLWPFWKAFFTHSQSVAFMVRDMMVPTTMVLNGLNSGTTGAAPRALPQDVVLSILSPYISAIDLVTLTVLFCAFASIFYTATLVKQATDAPLYVQLACTLFVLWNPYTIERMLQGHWSVVTAMWLLPAIAYLSATGRTGQLMLFLGICALTPTGWLLGGITALVFATSHFQRAAMLFIQLFLATPWLLVTLINNPAIASSAQSAALFAPRAEPGFGTLGSLLGLGGIWNANAVPASRTALTAGISVVLVLFILLGAQQLWKVYRPVAILTALALLLPFLASTDPGISALGWIVETIPGGGILRDSQKFVALAIPGFVLMLATSITLSAQWIAQHARSRLPVLLRTLSLAAGILIVCTVPGLPRDISPLQPRPIEPEWRQIINAVGSSPDSLTLLLPPGNYRMHEGTPVVDPALKMLPGTPVDPGFLVVNNNLIDGDPQSIRLLQETMRGIDHLAGSGVGWVLVDRHSFSPDVDTSALDKLLTNHQKIVQGNGLELYRIANPVVPIDHRSDIPMEIGLFLYWGVIGLGLCMSAVSSLRWLRKSEGEQHTPRSLLRQSQV